MGPYRIRVVLVLAVDSSTSLDDFASICDSVARSYKMVADLCRLAAECV
jgi:hypothetical protein